MECRFFSSVKINPNNTLFSDGQKENENKGTGCPLSYMKALLDCFCLPNYCSYWQCNAAENGNEYLQKRKKIS